MKQSVDECMDPCDKRIVYAVKEIKKNKVKKKLTCVQEADSNAAKMHPNWWAGATYLI